MGNDGGSIPKRRELVKEAARAPTATELKETLLESLTHLWNFCPLSSLPLDYSNTVSDGRGRLYNYESVLQCLLPSEDANVLEAQEEAYQESGIKSLKDVVRVKFVVRKDEKGREFRACPISLKELGASTKATYIVPCGHVFADVAFKEISESEAKESSERHCPECSEPFQDSNLIPILPTVEDEITKLKQRLENLKAKGLTHSLKKDKTKDKKKRKAEDAANGDGENTSSVKSKKEKKDRGANGIDSRINNAMTASLTARVLAEQEENNKRRKINEGLKREVVR
ncbi:Rtf2 RING-finger-domain-containing protein [Pestalotiopsis sp. NC0098]|nr:Rtf2 RING-finger-domain-containing protein [Pestalotiopsis sp. NC0098]